MKQVQLKTVKAVVLCNDENRRN